MSGLNANKLIESEARGMAMSAWIEGVRLLQNGDIRAER